MRQSDHTEKIDQNKEDKEDQHDLQRIKAEQILGFFMQIHRQDKEIEQGELGQEHVPSRAEQKDIFHHTPSYRNCLYCITDADGKQENPCEFFRNPRTLWKMHSFRGKNCAKGRIRPPALDRKTKFCYNKNAKGSSKSPSRRLAPVVSTTHLSGRSGILTDFYKTFTDLYSESLFSPWGSLLKKYFFGGILLCHSD